jgi:hypothetical protein
MEVFMRRRGERGEGQFGCIVGLLVLALVIFIAYKIIPVKVAAAELRQEVVDQARSAGSRNNDQIRGSIMYKAEQLKLPLAEKDLNIERGQDRIKIVATYTVPVEFPGYTWMWTQRHQAENPLF